MGPPTLRLLLSKMLYFVVLFVIFLGSQALDPAFVEKVKKETGEVAHNCIDQEHATADDVSELMSLKFPPTSHEAKCVLYCFYKHFNILTEKGDVDKEVTIRHFDELQALDSDLHGKIINVITACYDKKQIFNDHCETASWIATCTKNEADAIGITKEMFMMDA